MFLHIEFYSVSFLGLLSFFKNHISSHILKPSTNTETGRACPECYPKICPDTLHASKMQTTQTWFKPQWKETD